jgi:hypothetical protein
MEIYTITINGQEVDMTLNNGSLAYTFEYDGKRYGNAVKLENDSSEHLIVSTAVLVSNAYDSITNLITK